MHCRACNTTWLLQAEVASPPCSEWEQQTSAVNAFRHEFNEIRPHEALGQQTPASRYHPSERPYIEDLADPEYPDHFELRRVRKDGFAKLNRADFNTSVVLAGECIGLEPIDTGLWHLWFGPIFLARLRELGKQRTHFDKNTGNCK